MLAIKQENNISFEMTKSFVYFQEARSRIKCNENIHVHVRSLVKMKIKRFETDVVHLAERKRHELSSFCLIYA